ncbi:MAG: HAD family hydrolase [Clostridiales bacterium]|nr:HAD family hydrolase [Clostridiales bacterium]
MVRMIATDIDGTLLPSGNSRIPDRVLRALAQAMKEGIDVVPASGRMIQLIPEELMQLPGIRYVISCNGAAITEMESRECLFEKRIPAVQAAELLRMICRYDAYGCVYLPDGAYNWSTLPSKLSFFYGNRIPFFSQNPQKDLASYVEKRGTAVEKIFIAVFSQEEKDKIRRELGNIPGIHITSSSMWNLEINHIEADKGRALSWLSQELNIPAQDILAMGDNENDYTMLTFAGQAIVPANGTEITRHIATHIVPECEKCGTAVYLEEYVLESLGKRV